MNVKRRGEYVSKRKRTNKIFYDFTLSRNKNIV